MGAVVVAVLAWLVSTHNAAVDLDHDVAPWGLDHSSSSTRSVLRAVTRLGSGRTLVIALVAVGAVQLARKPRVGLAGFLVAARLGESLLTSEAKNFVDRARPTVAANASALGPAFPSGHTAGAAACYAAIAIAVGIGLSRRTRALLLGGAVGVAVVVASSRVLLGVHWITDVVGGLALGWGWCALCVGVLRGALFDQADRSRSVGNLELAHDGRDMGANRRT